MTHQCTRSHPHENMDAICELKTEIARLTNKLTQANQDNTDLDALCQDLQEMTYTQAMRIAELEAQPKRHEWVNATAWRGLTVGETAIIVKMLERGNFMVAIASIEAKLREKNSL